MSFRAEMDRLDDFSLIESAKVVGELLSRKGWRMATAESCTGGWVAKVMTDVPGSSQWFDGGIIAYANSVKRSVLGVRPESLATHSAVSEVVVREMVAGAIETLGVSMAVAISGIAGPDGGTAEKPVGTVWFALQARHQPAVTFVRQFAGTREQIRRRSVAEALSACERLLHGAPVG